jgi:hypothetical protein
MLKLTLALFVIWQLAVIIFQFSDAFRKRLGAWPFYLCGLLPTWRMFGPQPVDGDYLLYYRTAAAEPPATEKAGTPSFTIWQLLDYDKKPHPLLTLFFNPRANLVKALREISQEAVKAGSVNNVYYQLLLNELIRNLKPQAAQPAHRLVQFQICWKTPSSITPLFSSHVHPY